MRKREIHSIAHWCMMFILLMFPILIVGISTFNNKEDKEVVSISTSLNYSSVVGNEYIMNWVDDTQGMTNNTTLILPYQNISVDAPSGATQFRYGQSKRLTFFDSNSETLGYVDNVLTFTYIADSDQQIQIQPWFNRQLVITTFVTKTARDDVNQWINNFLDLPINEWYKSLMNVIGVGFTNSTVMNVIYVMPIYILWVFIFDVVVDCFLVIIKLPHKLLNRLSGGDNE